MVRVLMIVLLLFTYGFPAAHAARLSMDDRAALWPRASAEDKIDLTNPMGRAFSALSTDFDKHYFMRCLEETANIGNPGTMKLEEMVKACVSLKKDADPE